MAKQYRLYIDVLKDNYFERVPMGIYEGIQNARRHAMAFSKKSASGGCKVLSPRGEQVIGLVWDNNHFGGKGYEWVMWDRNHNDAHYVLLKDGSLGRKLD